MTDPIIAARHAVDELAAAGAVFAYRPSVGAMPASFTYALPDDGERPRCRRIIAAAKANRQTWVAVVAEVKMRSRDGRA